jgi:phage terminase large subunit GpA-like protein
VSSPHDGTSAIELLERSQWGAFSETEFEPVDKWAERVIVLPRSVSSIPGKLSLDWCPYLRQPLRDVTDDQVEQVTLCWSTQVGKTLAEIAVVLYAIVELKRPAMLVMPTDPAATGINVERVQPIIRESPELAKLLDPGRKKEMNRGSVRLGGIWLHFVGARSPTELASRAKGFICLDETDKYEEWTGKEADPIELATERARTFLDRVVLKASTPTTDRKYIWPELLASTNERYNVPCPHCGEYQALEMGSPQSGGGGGIKWPDGVRDADAVADGRLAWYECRGCGGRIEDQHKDAMLRQGVWAPLGNPVSRDGEVLGERPSRRKTGYHLWAAYSPWLTFSEIAAKFLSCYRNGRPVAAKLMNFRNSWQALPWQETKLELKEDALRIVRHGHHKKEVPGDVRIILVTVDVQEEVGRRYLYFVVRGWGDGGKSWLIDEGRKDSWEEVASLIRASYARPNGSKITPWQCGIDSGFKTDEVFEVCALTGAIAIKGSGALAAQQRLQVVPVGGEEIQRLTIRSDYYRDKLHRMIRDGERWFLATDISREYLDHMVAEQKVQDVDKRTGRVTFVWKCVPPGAANHLFDCEVMQLALCELLQLETSTAQPEEVTPEFQVRKETVL